MKKPDDLMTEEEMSSIVDRWAESNISNVGPLFAQVGKAVTSALVDAFLSSHARPGIKHLRYCELCRITTCRDSPVICFTVRLIDKIITNRKMCCSYNRFTGERVGTCAYHLAGMFGPNPMEPFRIVKQDRF